MKCLEGPRGPSVRPLSLGEWKMERGCLPPRFRLARVWPGGGEYSVLLLLHNQLYVWHSFWEAGLDWGPGLASQRGKLKHYFGSTAFLARGRTGLD